MFWTVVYFCVFFIVVSHVLLKGLMGEPILRIRGESDLPTASTSASSHPLKDDLLDYVKSHLKDLGRDSYEFSPKASNFYQNTHDSDVHHDRTDLSKYFEIEQSVPDTKKLLREISCNPIDQVSNCKPPIHPIRDSQTNSPLFMDQGSDGTQTYKPDMWRYANEKVMNGGFIDGVRGDDHQQSDWAVYPQSKCVGEPNYQTSYPFIQSATMW